MAGLHDKFTEEMRANLWKLFDEHVDQGIKHYRRNCTESIPSVDLNLVVSLCCLFESVTGAELGGKDIPYVRTTASCCPFPLPAALTRRILRVYDPCLGSIAGAAASCRPE